MLLLVIADVELLKLAFTRLLFQALLVILLGVELLLHHARVLSAVDCL